MTIIGVIISLLSLIMGMHWGMCVGGLIGAFLADMIAGTINYRSKKLNILAYIVYSFGPMGTYIAYFVDPEGWASTMLQNGTTQEYINAMNDAAALVGIGYYDCGDGTYSMVERTCWVQTVEKTI